MMAKLNVSVDRLHPGMCLTRSTCVGKANDCLLIERHTCTALDTALMWEDCLRKATISGTSSSGRSVAAVLGFADFALGGGASVCSGVVGTVTRTLGVTTCEKSHKQDLLVIFLMRSIGSLGVLYSCWQVPDRKHLEPEHVR